MFISSALQLTDCFKTVTKDQLLARSGAADDSIDSAYSADAKSRAILDTLHDAALHRQLHGNASAVASVRLQTRKRYAGPSAGERSGLSQIETSLGELAYLWVQAGWDAVQAGVGLGSESTDFLERLWTLTEAYVDRHRTQIVLCLLAFCCVSLLASAVLGCLLLTTNRQKKRA